MSAYCLKRFPAGKDRHIDVLSNKFVTYPHKVGNSILLYGRKDAHFPFHAFVGPEWPCMCVTYALIIVPSILFFTNVAMLWPNPAVLAVGILTFLLVLCAFSATACTEPGIVFVPSSYLPVSSTLQDRAELGQSSRTSLECSICNLERPRTASHCYECGLCVDQLDHHCPVSACYSSHCPLPTILSPLTTPPRLFSLYFPPHLPSPRLRSGPVNASPGKTSPAFTSFSPPSFCTSPTSWPSSPPRWPRSSPSFRLRRERASPSLTFAYLIKCLCVMALVSR